MASTRNKTAHPGVFFRWADRIGGKGQEKVFYIVFKRDGKVVEAKAGRQFKDDMTEAKAARMRAQMIEGTRQTPADKRREEAARMPIKKLWELYRAELKNRSTVVTDDSNFKHLEKDFADKAPAEIFTKDVDALKKSMADLGRKPQSIKHVLVLLRRIINFGVKKGLCPMPNPSELHFNMPKVNNEKTENLNAEQLKKLLETLDEYWDQATANIFRLILASGIRKKAVLNLKWADLDFERGLLTLRAEAAKKGKTEFLPMNDHARAILENTPRRGEYVFCNTKGGKRSEIHGEARKFLREKGALPPDFRPAHGLRHVFASWLASSGKVSMYELQKLLTHESPEMTQRYAHLHDEALRRASDVAGGMFKETKK